VPSSCPSPAYETKEVPKCDHGIHMSILAWLQVISIIVAALYFLISHDSSTATKLQDQQQSIQSINQKLDNLDKKGNDNAEKLAEIAGKLDLIIYHKNKK
jgi:cell division protein FtsL